MNEQTPTQKKTSEIVELLISNRFDVLSASKKLLEITFIRYKETKGESTANQKLDIFIAKTGIDEDYIAELKRLP